MILLLSPAKTLDFSPSDFKKHSKPRLLGDSEVLVDILKKKSATDLKKLMSVSDKIANLNVERFQSYTTPFSLKNAKQAALAFKGDVYTGLEAYDFDESEMDFAQEHLRILSGLYGVLKPLDLMQPYRLEMGTRLKNGVHKNLYEFWDKRITELLNKDLKKAKGETVVNLASKEYFHAVKPDLLKGRLLHIDFKELRGDKYKVIAFNAKKARGRMANLIVKERMTDPELMKTLVVNDYIYNEGMSDDNRWVFVKEQ